MTTTSKEAEEFARLALGSRALKNRRLRRAIIARLLNENGEATSGDEADEGEDTEQGEGEEGGEERELLKALIGSRILRRRRVRRMLLAHLLRSKFEGEGEGETDEGDVGEEGDEGTEEGGEGEGRDLVRALVASRIFRRRRVRRMLLAHLLRSRIEGEFDEGEDDAGDGGDDDRSLARVLIGSRILRRRRVRRALLAHLLREKMESV